MFLFTRQPRLGMTLIELMVVITITILLVAVSVPTFRPMLESRRAAGAARTVAGALQRARMKAMQDGQAYGVEFIPFTESNAGGGNAPTACYKLRFRRGGESRFTSPENIGVCINEGHIVLCVFAEGEWFSAASLEERIALDEDSEEVLDKLISARSDLQDARNDWYDRVYPGCTVQFGGMDKRFILGSEDRLAFPYDTLTLPIGTIVHAMSYKLPKPPRPVFAPPVVMPQGTIVDLQYSGFGNPDGSSHRFEEFTNFHKEAGGVFIQFSPSGYVDGYTYFNVNNELQSPPKPHGGLFYFCIGEWNRQGTDLDGSTLAEDGRNNLMTTSNLWVTVHPQTGQVRITEMAAIPDTEIDAWTKDTQTESRQQKLRAMLPQARIFATEHFIHVGGF